MDLENAEEILQILERYTKQKSKTIPDELNGYLTHVALTGDSVYSWSKVQYFFREKLTHVIKDFHDTTPTTEDLPISRNVDAFNYDSLKTSLLERFDLFNAAPFTIQRLSELLSEPKKHYCRLDKFMRALEKNILVVSTVEPGHRQVDSENGDSINGDPLMDINVDVEMDNKEPSSSSVSTIEKKNAIASQAAAVNEVSTENKTEQSTGLHNEEAATDEDDKVSTNGHHSTELAEKVNEDVNVESGDKTADVEKVTVQTQSNEHDSKDDSAEIQPVAVTADPSEPILDVPPIIKVDVEQSTKSAAENTEQSSESVADVEQLSEPVEIVSKNVDEKDAPDNEVSECVADDKDANEIKVDGASPNSMESVKHSRERDSEDDEDCRPTSAKLPKMEQPFTEDEERSSNADKVANNDVDEILSKEIAQVSDDDQTTTSKKNDEIDLEPVLPTTAPAAHQVDEQSSVGEQLSINIIDSITPISTDEENVQLDIIDDNQCESANDTASPLASVISNDLDILDEQEEDELIEPIITDVAAGEQNLFESPTLANETDVEMLPSNDKPEQMAVEDLATVAAPLSVNTDSAMDATQIIPTSDEQMDVFETNLVDQMDL